MTHRVAFAIVLIILLSGAFVWGVDMPHKKVEANCELCHSPVSFNDVNYDHDQTGFSLDGGHSRVDCLKCHLVEEFKEVDNSCLACHADVHEAKQGSDCEKCHSPSSWSVFDVQEIHLESSFPIMGRHALVDCESCHANLPRGDLSFNTTRCVGCHQNDYLNVSNPNHVAAGIHTDCQECHQMNHFRPALLPDHDVFFPIYGGAHADEWDGCNTCHTNPNTYQDFTCLVCHEHAQPGMDDAHAGMTGYAYNSSDCYLCHPTGEASNFYGHDALYFPVFSGTHSGRWDDCRTCHTVPTNRQIFDCLSCHKHNQVDTDGSHGNMAGYSYLSEDCYFCHPTGSAGQYLGHDSEHFPIFSSVHQGLWTDCSTCHPSPSQRRQIDCLSCHQHNQTDMTGVHGGISGYNYNSQDCYLCHPDGLRGRYLNHDAEQFPVFSGTHAGQWVDCTSCHPNVTRRSQIDCLSCHQHNQTDMNNVHGSMAGYNYNSQDCVFCHPTGIAGTFLAHDGEFFPIFSGTHQGQWADCATCHPNPSQRQQIDCLSCHQHNQADMNGVHGSMPGYNYNSQDCYLCHPNGLKGQYLDHDANNFPVFSGTHFGQWSDCSECHTVPEDRTSFSCLACHPNKTTDNTHTGMAGYIYSSDNCYFCHPTGIAGQYLDHDAVSFPIFSGTHLGQWSDCITCHPNPSQRLQIDCLSCHQHGQPTMDGFHGNMPGYSYNSQDCYLCHPSGLRGQYTAHDVNNFPIFSGIHLGQWNNCSNCHTVPGDRISYDCLNCHTNPATDNTHGGMSGYSYLSTACYDCHPNGERGTYVNHDADQFPIFSGVHRRKWSSCATCHTDPNNRAVFTCFNCHKHDQSKTDEKHSGESGYLYDPYYCIGCHPDGRV